MQVSDIPLGVVFGLCSVFLLLAAGCQMRLAHITGIGSKLKQKLSDSTEDVAMEESTGLMEQQRAHRLIEAHC